MRPADPSEEHREREMAEVVSQKAQHSKQQAAATLVMARTGHQADAIGITGDRSSVEHAARKAKKVEEEIRSELE